MRLNSVVAIAAALSLSACGVLRTQERSPTSAPPPFRGDVKTAFALKYIDGRAGTGAAAAARKCHFVHYTGWLENGTKFDSSRDTTANGQPRPPISFAQGARRVIAGWDAGFEGMKVGGQRRLIIPYQLGYGELGRTPTIPPRATLIFDVELMAVVDTVPRAAGAANPQCPAWNEVSSASR